MPIRRLASGIKHCASMECRLMRPRQQRIAGWTIPRLPNPYPAVRRGSPLAHRDQVRVMIQNGGTSFLIGLLFGDITGSAAAIFAARSLIDASYSRQAESNADAFAIETMRSLGRSPAPMGELLFRVTGAQGNNTIGILASHPLTEERRELKRREDRPATGPEILSATEWRALKNICRGQRAK
jgi:Peptidase family M48